MSNSIFRCILTLLLVFPCASAFGAASGDRGVTIQVSADGPVRSVVAARDLIRTRRAKGEWTNTPITVAVAPGTYYLSEPIEFGPEDSGAADAPITYKSLTDEQPVISGGQPITGWREVKVNGKTAWAVEIPEVKQGNWYFRQLFVNGQRRPRTRLPQKGFYRFTAVPDIKPGAGYRPGQSRAHFEPGQIKDWKNLDDVDLVVLHYWVAPRMQIANVDQSRHLLEFTKPTMRRLSDSFNTRQFARFYVDNVFEALDTPGHWYLDRPAGTLYYIPMPGEDIDTTVAVAPKLQQLVRIQGGDKPVQHIHLRNLAFAHAEWCIPEENASDQQAAIKVPGAVLLQNAGHCLIRNCTVSHVANYAVEVGRGCTDVAIDNCILTDLGAGGIKIGHNSNHTTVRNCQISWAGKFFHNAVGVWIGHSSDNTVAHNHIHHLYYTGVSVGWTWGYREPSQAARNRITHNHIHHIGQGWLSDMGGIYTLGVSPGTELRYNLIHDVQADHYGGWGLYNDEGSTGILMENNVVYHTTHGGYHQHYGRQNIVRNNILAFGQLAQLMRTREEDHVSFIFEHNIVYFTEPTLLGSNWKNDKFKMDHNLYWRTGGGPFDFAGASLEEWIKRGHDVHSIIADPLFVDPAGADFTLKPSSPAAKIGFKPIDTTKIGPLGRQ